MSIDSLTAYLLILDEGKHIFSSASRQELSFEPRFVFSNWNITRSPRDTIESKRHGGGDALGILERFQRRMAEGAFVRAFRSELQPVEVASAIQREMDDRAAVVAKGRTLVPNDFVIELAETDHERLDVYAESLGVELANLARDYAKEQGYMFLGPVRMRFEGVPEMTTGTFRIRSGVIRGSTIEGGEMTASRPNAPSRIFMSYRREDTAYPAAWLYERLADTFGKDQVFKDIDSIELGDDFAEVIVNAVGSCNVLLALMGVRWLTIADQYGRRRLDNPDDFVRLEIEAALARDVRVIPILVEGARMPRADELPASLARLTRRQALELSPGRFHLDSHRLLRVLDRTIEAQQAPPGS